MMTVIKIVNLDGVAKDQLHCVVQSAGLPSCDKRKFGKIQARDKKLRVQHEAHTSLTDEMYLDIS